MAAQKKVWRINPSDTEVAGYVRQVSINSKPQPCVSSLGQVVQAGGSNLTYAIVRAAGHIVPGTALSGALCS